MSFTVSTGQLNWEHIKHSWVGLCRGAAIQPFLITLQAIVIPENCVIASCGCAKMSQNLGCKIFCVKSYITLHSGILVYRESYLHRSDDADFFLIVKAALITNTQSCPSLYVCLEHLGQHIFLGSGLPITRPCPLLCLH